MFEITTTVLGQLAGILAFVAIIPYVISILKKKTKPSKTTWLIWAFNDFLGLLSYFSVGARDTLWAILGLSMGTFVVAALSLKYGKDGWSRLDVVCLIGTGLSVILWLISGSPLVTLLAVRAIGTFGAIPTMWKAYHKPSEENRLAWGLFSLSALINLFAVAVKEGGFAIVFYPVTVLINDGIIALFVFWPRRKRVNKFRV